jgi:hypothetical protein
LKKSTATSAAGTGTLNVTIFTTIAISIARTRTTANIVESEVPNGRPADASDRPLKRMREESENILYGD